MQHHRLFVPGPAGQLEALYREGDPEAPAVVVCHPHPQHGGTMRNKVVYWMARTFEEQGCTVLRFNFRGVEKSDGDWDEGRGEALDAGAVLDWVHDRHAESPLWLAGFSFGCYAGLQAARDDGRVARMFAVAPAVNHWSFDFMRDDSRPLTVVQGADDEIVPCSMVEYWSSTLDHARIHTIRGAGHFFSGHMDAMRQALLADAVSVPEVV